MTNKSGNGKSMQSVDYAPGQSAEGAIDTKPVLESTGVWQRRDDSRNADSTVVTMLQRHSRDQQDNSRHGRQPRILAGSRIPWWLRHCHGEFSIGGSRSRENPLSGTYRLDSRPYSQKAKGGAEFNNAARPLRISTRLPTSRSSGPSTPGWGLSAVRVRRFHVRQHASERPR